VRREPNPHPPGSDEYYIYETLELAHRGLGWTSPNPLVGALLVREGAVIGRGAHLHDGAEHAEVLALREAGDARGAACYVNLEPCAHVARQPSCCHELCQAGVTRVVYGTEDADGRTANQAQRVLAGLGVACRAGVLRDECARFLDYYSHGHCLRRVFIHLKLALSLDAKLACATGHSQWLSGPESLGYAHYLRQKYDAVLVGHRTVAADDPRLSVRPETLAPYRELEAGTAPRNPVRVILDPRFALLHELPRWRLGSLDGSFRSHLPRLIFAGRSAALPVGVVLPAHVELLGLAASTGGQLSFDELARRLWGLGMRSLLVEGGARLARELLKQRAVDKVSLVYTPRLLGDDAQGFSPPLGCQAIEDGIRLNGSRAFSLGQDCVMEGYPQWPG
jgi:diaminohydroxyphosphoribosylaminopyrimidine deaminase/5-amino-6-(5-phosphoribosylamino)uracil reductase